MGFLKDVSVSKVSFVRKAANKRKFLLLKSDDANVNDVNDVNDVNGNSNDNINRESYKPMRKEVKDAILQIVKSVTPAVVPDNIVDLLKAKSELNLTDAEIVEVQEHIELVKSAITVTAPVNPANNDTVKKENLEKMEKMDTQQLLKQVQDLTTQLAEISKSTQRREILTWLEKECAYLPEDINKAADVILQLQSVSPTAAEAYKATLQKSSAALEQAPMLREHGISTDTLLKSESDGFEIVKKFNTALTEIRKSGDKNIPSADSIVNVIKSFGDEWTNYREAHALRAKRG